MPKSIRSVGLVATLFLPALACAQDADIAAYHAAAARFDTLAAASVLQGDMPRLSSAAGGEVIEQLSDRKRLLQTKTYTSRDMNALLGICSEAFRVMQAYGTFNPDAKADAKIDDAQVGRNFLKYSPELAKIHPFVIQCFATTIPLLTGLLQSLPPEQLNDKIKSGLTKTRSGITQMFGSAIEAATTDEISVEYRLAIVTVTSETASVYAGAIPLATRSNLLTRIQRLPKSLSPDMASQMQKTVAALQDTTCKDLCAIDLQN